MRDPINICVPDWPMYSACRCRVMELIIITHRQSRYSNVINKYCTYDMKLLLIPLSYAYLKIESNFSNDSK